MQAEWRWLTKEDRRITGEVTLRVPPPDVVHSIQRGRRKVPLMFLTDLRVRVDRRGTGLVRVLMDTACAWADETHTDLWLYVHPFGQQGKGLMSLRGMYRRWGFDDCDPGAGYLDEMVRRWQS